jgi:8-oxo-dGTP pyrophosphatase MutT (NUDIX family)
VNAPDAIVEQVIAARRSAYAYLKASLGVAMSWTPADHEPVELNGISFTVGTPDYPTLVKPSVEPPNMLDSETPQNTAGVIVVESDGRVWTVSPANQFGGYVNTFPKGHYIGDWETAQEAAIRETWEESGIIAAIDSCLGDFKRSGDNLTRYYLGHRVGGAPWAMGAESERVNLVPLAELREHLLDAEGNETADHTVLAVLRSPVKLACGGISSDKNATTMPYLSKESAEWNGGYRIHDLRLDYQPLARRGVTGELMRHLDQAELLKDIEAACAYSPVVQWSKAVSDASHEYLTKGDAGLAGWLLARGTAPEYRFDYPTDELRLDGEPVKCSGELATRAAKRFVEHIRAAPARDVEVYRGLHSNTGIYQLEMLKAGDTLPFDRVVSFSAHKKVALHFAEKGNALNFEYVLKIIGPAKGICLDALADRDQGEFVTQGKFQVEEVGKAAVDYVRRPSGLSYPVQRCTILMQQTGVY